MLIKFKFIKIAKIGGKNVYFDINVLPEAFELIHIISKEKCREIIEYLELNDLGTSKTKLAKELSMHPRTLQKYLIKLEKYNIISREKMSKKIYYFLDHHTYELIAKKEKTIT